MAKQPANSVMCQADAKVRISTDPDQWRALMALSDEKLLQAWKQAQEAQNVAQSQNLGQTDAARWVSLIEGAAATRFGVGRHMDRYRAEYPPR